LAASRQVPGARNLTVVPLTEQTVGAVHVNTTGLPDGPPVADKVAVPPTVPLAGGVKLIVWEPGPTSTEPTASVAAAYSSLPAWSAVS
jgi:hypothetical protein